MQNLDLDGVYFTSPDGGVLTLTNGGYSFAIPIFIAGIMLLPGTATSLCRRMNWDLFSRSQRCSDC